MLHVMYIKNKSEFSKERLFERITVGLWGGKDFCNRIMLWQVCSLSSVGQKRIFFIGVNKARKSRAWGGGMNRSGLIIVSR